MNRVLLIMLLCPSQAWAHASDQSFVLLLPTDFYISAGVLAVALTVVALFLVPDRLVTALFSHHAREGRSFTAAKTVTSIVSFMTIAALVALGIAGPRDPLSNLMPLMFWTVGWMGLVTLSGLFGNLWSWANPWSGLYRLIAPDWRPYPLPNHWGHWPAVVLLIAFTAFLLADTAPDDPTRLAYFISVYWSLTMAGLLICGQSWLRQVELGHVIIAAYARLSIRSQTGIGGPGWQVIARAAPPAAGIFALTLLAAGSFDGLNETFWWLGLIGVNPLEFPGRSAVIGETILGLLATLALLWAAFALTVWLGLRLGGGAQPFRDTTGRLALSLLPIALVYHAAHYLPSFLVTIQYTWAALSDPLDTGADLLGIQPFNVTTGFFNRLDTVRVIWLTQAGLVVFGHVWSVLLSHRVAMEIFPKNRAAWATLPLSIFMIGYTLLGLWLLATPKGA